MNTLSLAPDVSAWLTNSRRPRILHIFDQACNLINECREVLSVVTPQIGNGPFNLVIGNDVCFSEHLSLRSPVSISPDHITVGDLTIHVANAKIWDPRPDWKRLHREKEFILGQLRKLPITNYREASLSDPFSNSLVSNLTCAFAAADISSAIKATSKLAGLGIGLTPAGDDFLMGALYAAWIIHPHEFAKVLIEEVANTAVPLTTSLSAAWLKSAGKGEAGILWHELFNSLILPMTNLESSISRILSIGHTSGADALAGFIATFISYAESETQLCHS